jgi:hypothetical protein
LSVRVFHWIPFSHRSCSQVLYLLSGIQGGLSSTVLPGKLHIRGLLTAHGESPVAFAGYRLDHLPAESILKRADETKRRANLMRQAAGNGGGLQAARSSPDAERSKS